MSSTIQVTKRVAAASFNRRRFLRGAGGVAIALPFLEGLPERSAWAQSAPPVFSFYMVAACGVVGNKFFPTGGTALTEASLAAASDKATAVLAPHAANLIFVSGVNYPQGRPGGCGHAEGLCQALTARTPSGNGSTASASGPSADWVLSQTVNGGAEPLNLYAGNRRNGYIAERISFKSAGTGGVRSADDNPYILYSRLTGLVGMTGNPTPMADELLVRRKSVNDLVKDELKSLMSSSVLSSKDKARLQQHADCIRDVENTMTGMANTACNATGVNTTRLQALKTSFAFKMDGMIEEVAKLHMELVAMAFACNYNRVAAMQWGDGTDATQYNVPTNGVLGNWQFHHISHRVQDNSAVGSNSNAEKAHAEIDRLRMETLKYGLDQLAARGLTDKVIVLWTNHVADGPSHRMTDVPHIIYGTGGGYLKTGQLINAGGAGNGKIFNTLMYAAGKDKNPAAVTFGSSGAGELPGLKK